MKIIDKIILSTLLTTTLFSQEFSFDDSYSLVGVETSYSTFDVENDDTTTTMKTYKNSSAGLKIGAQSEDYRIFLSARYYDIKDFDSAYTLGGEFQYMINFSKYANFYLGVNGGVAEMSFIDARDTTRSISDSYFGGDAGFNIHATKSFDVEIGARVMSLNAKNIQNNITYSFNTMSCGYVSLIYKYKMD